MHRTVVEDIVSPTTSALAPKRQSTFVPPKLSPKTVTSVPPDACPMLGWTLVIRAGKTYNTDIDPPSIA
eukprot:3355619-Rhodomonas_salina.3